MEDDVNDNVDLDARRNRIYVIRFAEDKMKGSFIFGRRGNLLGPEPPGLTSKAKTRAGFATTILTDTGF